MPRISRKNSKSCYYHVMVQGINKEHIFKETKYMEKYKKLILEKLSESNIIILAYCIMINHVHLLVYAENVEELGKYMHKVNVSYSMYYNKLNTRVGYVFRNRYRTQEILSRRQLYTCLRYIHNNPVKAKIVNKASDYYFSSYNEFVNEKCIINSMSLDKLFESVDNYLEQFNNIHQLSYDVENDNEFIDEEENYDIVEYIDAVKKKYNTNIEEIKKDKELLKNFIKNARKQCRVTYRSLASILGISKSKVEIYDKK